jgi:hypothetical protein
MLAVLLSTPVYPATREQVGALDAFMKEDKMNQKKDQHDKAVEDSFPASDPPAATGITGPRVSTPKTEELDDRDEQQKN